MAAVKDLTGRKFGRLTVVRLHPEPYRSPSGKPTRRWICRCECGEETVVLTNALTGKNGTKSCGCAQVEKALRTKDDLTGQRFGRWTVIRRAPLMAKAKNGERNGWLCQCDCGTMRVVLTRHLVGGKSKSCGCDRTEKALNRIEIENVLQRYAGTHVSAIRPGRKLNKNNRSGKTGVYWNEREGCWIAKIGIGGKQITIGRYATFELARKARIDAEHQYFAPIIEDFDREMEEFE